MSAVLTPISLRQSLNMPSQSLKVPIFATFPGIMPLLGHFQPNCFSTRTGVAPVPLEPLFGLEYRRSLFHISRQAFLGVFALEEQLLVFALDRESRLHGNLPSGLHCALDPSYGLCGLVWRAELLRVFDHVFHEAIALVDVVDDAELLRLYKRERVARHHQLDGLALAYHPREPLRTTGAGEHAEIHLGQTNLAGVLASDANVGRHGDFQATAHAVAVNRGDHQLRRVLQ